MTREGVNLMRGRTKLLYMLSERKRRLDVLARESGLSESELVGRLVDAAWQARKTK